MSSTGATRPAVVTLLVQVAALALALGRPSLGQACAAGVAALFVLLANDARDPYSCPRSRVLAGAALITAAALGGSLLTAGPHWFTWFGPVAVLAVYVLATFSPISLPRKRNTH
jgi:hypothetical protein